MTTNSLELIAIKEKELADLKAAAASEIEAKKQDVMGEVLEHLKENNVSLAELTLFARISGSKYSQGKETWSGKGKKPDWVNKALAGGKTLEDLLTKKANVAAG